MAAKKRAPAKKWAMLGSVGFQVVIKSDDGVWGPTHPVIAWAWSASGEMRAVVCLKDGPYMLSPKEQRQADFQQARLV